MKKILLSFSLATAAVLFAQDTCETAVDISAGGTFTVTQVNGTAPAQTCDGGANTQTAGEWYYYNNPSSTEYHEVFLTTNLAQNGGGDTRVQVYSGDCSGLVCEASGDDVSADNYLSEVTFLVPPMMTYIIAFDDRWDASGFDFEVTATSNTPDCSTNLPFNEDFESQTDFIACYTVEDLDGNGLAWISQQNLDLDMDGTIETFATNGSGGEDAPMENDYLISPSFNLSAGVQYDLTAHFSGWNQQTPTTQVLEALVLDGPSSSANVVATLFSTNVNNGTSFETLESSAFEETGSFTPSENGTYYIAFRASTSLTGTNGFVLLFDYNLSTSMSVNDVKSKNVTSVYPNPAIDVVNINLSDKFNADRTSVSVYDMNGKLVAKFPSVDEVNVLVLPKGVYVLEMSDGKLKETKKLIKK